MHVGAICIDVMMNETQISWFIYIWSISASSYNENRLLDSLVVECLHRVLEVPGSIASQGPPSYQRRYKNGTSIALV